MTTARQIKRLVAPLLARNSDLALVDRQLVVVRPVRHLLRALLIDRTSEAIRFRPKWIVFHLFRYRRGWAANAGANVHRRGLWYIEAPGVETALREQIEAEVLPKLRAIETIPDYVVLATGPGIILPPLAWPEEHMLMHVATGECEAARAICTRQARFWDTNRDPDLQDEIDRWKTLGQLLMDNDRAGLAALLHDWEAQTVANLELSHLWERTPFPLEETA